MSGNIAHMKDREKYLTVNSQQTKKLAENLARQILAGGQKNRAAVLLLQGELGAGKTTFLQGFAKGLRVKEKILSSTFILIKKFPITRSQSKSIPQTQRPLSLWYRWFYHVDCYRLQKANEILDLGFKKIISNPENIVAVEWPEKVKKISPKDAISVKFKVVGKDERSITIIK